VPGLPHVLGVALLVTGLSGCSLLDLLFGVEPFPSFDPDEPFPFPTAEATFTTGTATMELDNEVLVLDELTGEASFSTDYGINVRWTNGEGRYLSLFALPDMGMFPDSSYLSFDWLADDHHWVIMDPGRCVVTIEKADASGVAGAATCRGLEWSDWFGSYSGGLGLPEPIPGEEPFDAEITFEAR
jgi:hypothetical protein